MSFVADLRYSIHCFRFADRRLSQLPTPQAASSSSLNHRTGQRCFCLWGFISDSYDLQSGSREWHPSSRPRRTYILLFVCRGHAQGHFPVEGAVWKLLWTLVSVRNGRLWNVTCNLLRTTSLKFLLALKFPCLGPTRILSEESLMKTQRRNGADRLYV